MSFHLCVYQATANGSSGYTQLNAVTNDPVMSVSNNSYFLPDDGQIIFAHYQGATASRGRLVTPSLNAMTYPMIYPASLRNNQEYASSLSDYTSAPIRVKSGDLLEVDIVNGGSEASYAAAAVTFNPMPAPSSNIIVLRGSASTTLTANSLTTLSSITWDQALPPGLWNLTTASVQSPTGIYFRVILTGQGLRPGGVCTQHIAYQPYPFFRMPGRLPSFGTFVHSQMPRIEILATAADTVQNVFLFLSKIG